jgi:hypothetical protein
MEYNSSFNIKDKYIDDVGNIVMIDWQMDYMFTGLITTMNAGGRTVLRTPIPDTNDVNILKDAIASSEAPDGGFWENHADIHGMIAQQTYIEQTCTLSKHV